MGYIKRNKKCITKEGMTHAQKAWKKECQEKRKDAYPKKVCHMSTRHVEKKRREEKNIAPVQEKNIQGERWIMQRSPSTLRTYYPSKIFPHLHILIRLYDSFLLGSCFWLSNRSKASMPLNSYPELHIRLIRWYEKRRQQLCLGEDPKQNEWFKRTIWGARLFFCFKI